MLSRQKNKTGTKPGRTGSGASRPPGPLRRALQRIRSPLGRRSLWATGIAAGCLAIVLGLRAMEQWVLTQQAPVPRSLRLTLVAAPAWMPASLRQRIVADLAPRRKSTYDDLMPRKISQRARKNPWIRTVHKVRRRSAADPDEAVVELHAEYRKAVACVRLGRQLAYVADDGVRLPAEQVPQWVGRLRAADGTARQVCFLRARDVPAGFRVWPVHYFRIDGVRGAAPLAGRRWPGKDMSDALKLIALVAQRPYANQITVVDVRNHSWRISRGEPCLRMYAQVPKRPPTDIRFGRFSEADGDYNVSAARKVAYLDRYNATHGVLAGQNAFLDLRYDELHVSNR